jgi:uroporphyrin-III C-methyltransferase/precorrin-2 dehydrogenase/sirohydrochlorin ferrochelatase
MSGVTTYPIFLRLDGRRVVVVGGGQVAARRLGALRDAGADITVIAPYVEAAITGVTTIKRSYDGPADLAGAALVHACTDSAEVNARVAADAEAAGLWCVRADDADASAAHVPAVARAGDIAVAISAGDPGRSIALKAAIAALLDTGELTARPTRGLRQGWVALVGGGPGDPGLITVQGRRLLAEADVVVIDRLAPRALIDALDPSVEIVDAGKAAHAHNLTQDQINAVLVDRARAGKRVVRLKGGDPFVFGRGGEEAIACVQAGVPFLVVPGVTSAIAVPALAGIPVTHRGYTQDFTVVSAHLDPTHAGVTVDWQALADSRGTIVLLMAVERLDKIASELVTRGRSPETPVAIIQSGSTDSQRVVVGELGTIADLAVAENVQPPCIVVVGDVVKLREQLGHGA